jgi:hypothetical protein
MGKRALAITVSYLLKVESMLSNPTEKQIENQILTYLRNKGIFVWKNQSTGVFDPTKKVFRKSSNPHHISGVSDILGILKDGRFLAIEVKKPYISKKTLKVKYRTQEELQKLASVDQVNFIEKIRLSNGVSFYADSLEVVEDQLSFAKIEQG